MHSDTSSAYFWRWQLARHFAVWKINSDLACRVCLLLWNFFVSAFVSVVQYEVALTTLVKRTVCNVTNWQTPATLPKSSTFLNYRMVEGRERAQWPTLDLSPKLSACEACFISNPPRSHSMCEHRNVHKQTNKQTYELGDQITAMLVLNAIRSKQWH